jgi:signal transduction histidine kinase
MQDQIFTPFMMPGTNGNGAGLSMSIAQDIVSEHNGAMWTTSSKNNGPGKGATVTVILPIRPAS